MITAFGSQFLSILVSVHFDSTMLLSGCAPEVLHPGSENEIPGSLLVPSLANHKTAFCAGLGKNDVTDDDVTIFSTTWVCLLHSSLAWFAE